MLKLVVFLSLILLQSCAVLHHVQLGDIDGSVDEYSPFEVQLEASPVFAFISGPQTGVALTNEKYALSLKAAVYGKCPSGLITNLMIQRETYIPFMSPASEIIKVSGLCGKK